MGRRIPTWLIRAHVWQVSHTCQDVANAARGVYVQAACSLLGSCEPSHLTVLGCCRNHLSHAFLFKLSRQKIGIIVSLS